MVFGKWRARKASIKYLREQDMELQAEYKKMRQWEMQSKAQQPPTYDDVRESSGESLDSSRWQPQGDTTNGDDASRVRTGSATTASTSATNTVWRWPS